MACYKLLKVSFSLSIYRSKETLTIFFTKKSKNSSKCCKVLLCRRIHSSVTSWRKKKRKFVAHFEIYATNDKVKRHVRSQWSKRTSLFMMTSFVGWKCVFEFMLLCIFWNRSNYWFFSLCCSFSPLSWTKITDTHTHWRRKRVNGNVEQGKVFSDSPWSEVKESRKSN